MCGSIGGEFVPFYPGPLCGRNLVSGKKLLPQLSKPRRKAPEMGLLVLAVPLAALGMPTAAAVRRHDDPVARSMALRRVGLGIIWVFAAMVGVFLAGEALDNPGGWEAVGMIAGWAVPLAVVAFFAWVRPRLALRVFGTAAAVLVVVNAMTLVSMHSVQVLERTSDPARDIAGVIFMAALGVAGYKVPDWASRLVMATFVLNLSVSLFTASAGGVISLILIGSPPLASAAYYIAAERVLMRNLNRAETSKMSVAA